MVSLARNWSLVPEKEICHVEPTSSRGQDGGAGIAAAGGQVLSVQFNVGENCGLAQLEHVQVRRRCILIIYAIYAEKVSFWVHPTPPRERITDHLAACIYSMYK